MRTRARNIANDNRLARNFLILLIAVLVVAACTHRRTWTTNDVTIITDPPGARCTFERDGVTTQYADVTPITVTFTSIGPDIDIRCARFGYTPVSTRISGNRYRTIRFQLSPDNQAQSTR